jgi:hypothetical protein
MNFEQEIEEWINIDNEMKKTVDYLNKLKERKTKVHDKLLSYAKHKSIIQYKQDKLKFISVNSYQPLTFLYIDKCLREIIKRDEQVTQIINYIKQKREIKIIEDIKRFNNK